jgi:hypothetical protein
MKRWFLGLFTAVAMLVGAQSVKADWVPCVNPNGTVSHWFDPSDPMPPLPPYPGGNWIILRLFGQWIAIDLNQTL